MNNKFLPSLVTGFAAGVLLTIPGIKSIGFFITLPVAVYFALLLHVKLNKAELPVLTRTALLFGVLTGLWAAFFSTTFDTILTFVSHTNDFVDAYPQMQKSVQDFNLGKITQDVMAIFNSMYHDIRNYGFSPIYTFVLLVSNLFFDVLFGLLGGIIGKIYINRNTTQQ